LKVVINNKESNMKLYNMHVIEWKIINEKNIRQQLTIKQYENSKYYV